MPFFVLTSSRALPRFATYMHLMRALVARDNVAEALVVYDRLPTELREELGISPSSRMQELHAQLLQSA